MKKQLLLGSALLAFGFASAQTVQNIPTAEGSYLEISETAVDYDPVLLNDPTTGEPIEHFTYNPSKVSVTGDDGKKISYSNNPEAAPIYVNNTHDGESATWAVKSEAASCYIIRFAYSSKNDAPGASGTFQLLDKATENSVWEKTFEAAATATASYAFFTSEVYVDETIPAGEYLFRINFHQEDPLAPSFRICQISFEAREEVVPVNLNVYCEPAEGGSVTVKPSRTQFVSGTEVTLQAIANTCYKFVGWDNGIDPVFTTNPYKFNIEDETDITAMFEEVQMWSNIPGYVNFENTRLVGQGAVQYDTHQIKFYNPESGEYDILHEGAPGSVPWLGNYRNGNSERFELNATEAGTYNFVFHWSWKEKKVDEAPTLTFQIFDKDAYDADATAAMPEWAKTFAPEEVTKQWFQFKEQRYDDVTLTKGRKYLNILFKEPNQNKYTINILDMKFGIGDNYGEDAAIEEVAIDANKAVRAYNLQGIEVPATTKGLIIVDGKKVYNK